MKTPSSTARLLWAVLFFFTLQTAVFCQTSLMKPHGLKTDSLITPLGDDNDHPRFSWLLQDDRPGARQTAYEIQITSTPAVLTDGKADVWDSGRVTSDQSIGVVYAGPALAAAIRYYWQVKVWDKDGQAYPTSDPSWWETGLLGPQNWQASWIGYEEQEERSIREAGAAWVTNPATTVTGDGDTHHDFRLNFDLSNGVRRADLFVTGEDTAAAWVNGKPVLQAQPLPPWKQAPWKTYTRQDVTRQLRKGKNLLAVEVVHYARPNPGRGPQGERSQSPMSATLYVELKDGSVKVFKTGDSGWTAAFNAAGKWYEAKAVTTGWAAAVPYSSPQSSFGPAEMGNPWPTGAVKALRRTFTVDKPVASARLYATALGAYLFHLNGSRVGDQVLSPGWMDFRQHVPYQVYDVTTNIKSGGNAIAAYLAPGWYTTPLQWYRQGFNYGTTPPALKAQLRIEHTDGSLEWIATDASWKADVSPILSSEIYDGETYDARREQPGWDTAEFADAQWKPAEIVHPTIEPNIVWQYFQPIRAKQELSAKDVTSPKPGVYIYDFGQNLSGVVKLQVQGKAGTNVQLRFAEVLNPDGTMYVENLRTAKATDHYILAGKGTEEYRPYFTFHGFRYAEVSGLPDKPAADALKAVVFHTDTPQTAQLKTGSKMIDQLWSNILWGQRSNFVGVPTDCPQRDERLGWTADAQVFWRAASYNMDTEAFSRKFSADLRGTQVGTSMYGIFAPGTLTPSPGHGTGWSDAGIIIPWTSWIQTGDNTIIEQNWDAMEKYLSAIQADNPDYLWKKNYGIPFGDWLSPEGVTAEDLIATAYWAYDVSLMRQMAHALGHSSDEQKYGDLFQKIKAAFIQAYVHSDGFVGAVPPPPVFASGVDRKLSDKPVDTQTSYVLAIYMDLLPDSLRPAAAQRLIDKLSANNWRLGTGFLGTPYLLAALTDTGHSDIAYRLLLNTEYPSWGYLVEHGATTMWERWNGDQMRGDPSMNSYNHYAYGAVADWIYRYSAGIDTMSADPGFHTLLLHPNFDARLGHLDFTYESPYGTVHSSWSVAGPEATWDLTIPANAKGRLPLSTENAAAFKLDGSPLSASAKIKAIEAGIYELPAGEYSFKVTLPTQTASFNK